MADLQPSAVCPHEWPPLRPQDAEQETWRAHLAQCALCRERAIWEAWLAQQVSAIPLPAAPASILPRVRGRLRRRTWQRVGGLTAAGLLFLGLLWSIWPRQAQRPSPEGERVEASSPTVLDLPDSQVLFAAPPVDSFEVLGQQQAAYLTALGHAEEKP